MKNYESRKKIVKNICFLLIASFLYLFISYQSRLSYLYPEIRAYIKDIDREMSQDVRSIHIIDYNDLSKQYKEIISEDEYNSAYTDEELLNLFMKINTVKAKDLRPRDKKLYWKVGNVAISPYLDEDFSSDSLSQRGKALSGILYVDDTSYPITHRIHVNNDCLATKFNVVYWNVNIKEINR